MKESTRVPSIEETEMAKRSYFCQYFRPNDRFAQMFNRNLKQKPVASEDVEDIPELEKELREKYPEIAYGGILKNLKDRGPVFFYPLFDETMHFPDMTKLPLSIKVFSVGFARDSKALEERWYDHIASEVSITKDEEDPEKLHLSWGGAKWTVRVKVVPRV